MELQTQPVFKFPLNPGDLLHHYALSRINDSYTPSVKMFGFARTLVILFTIEIVDLETSRPLKDHA